MISMRKVKYKYLNIVVLLCFLLNIFVPIVNPAVARAETNINDFAVKAVQSSYKLFNHGTQLGSYDVYMLTRAGADMETWVKDEISAKASIMTAADETLLNPNEKTTDWSGNEVYAKSSKTIVQQYLAAKSMGENEKASQLVTIIKNRQSSSGDGSIDGNAFGDINAVELLGRSGDVNQLNTANAITYILAQQDDASGAWTNTWNDVMATAEAVRALKYLLPYAGAQADKVQAAIDKGRDWLQTLQKSDGSIQDAGGYDDKAVDSAEVICTLKLLGIEPSTWIKDGKSLEDYMLNQALNADGTFGASKNLTDNTWVLDAYLALGAVLPADSVAGVEVSPLTGSICTDKTQQYTAQAFKLNGTREDVSSSAIWSVSDSSLATVNSTGVVTGVKAGNAKVLASYQGCKTDVTLTIKNSDTGNPPPVQPQNSISVSIAVVGKDGSLLFGPNGVILNKDDSYGFTPLGALNAAGLSWQCKDNTNSFLVRIGNDENFGSSGWMYKVNDKCPNGSDGKDPSVNAYKVNEFDKIIFWYSTSTNSNGPIWNDLGGKIPVDPKMEIKPDEKNEIKESLLTYYSQLDSLNNTNHVMNADKRMTEKEAEDLKKAIESNTVSLSEKVGNKESLLTDHEVSLLIPEKALDEEKQITVKELAEKERTVRFAVKVASSVYEFGPSGTKFDKPVTISLKIPVSKDMDISQLSPAWYDEQKKDWIPVPAVIDLKTGMIVFQINHFTKFAVIENADGKTVSSRKTFSDVGEDWAWARDAIEILAGKEIINGTDTGFEPQRSITRAEFVQLINKALGLMQKDAGKNVFADVNTSDWFAEAVEIACSHKIVSGYPDGTFAPDKTITRNEIAVIMRRLNNQDNLPKANAHINDINTIPVWAIDGVQYVYAKGLMNGYQDGRFMGNNDLSRAEAAVLVYRYVNLN